MEAKVLATLYEIYNEKIYDLLTEDHHEPRRIENTLRWEPMWRVYPASRSSFKDAEGLLEVG